MKRIIHVIVAFLMLSVVSPAFAVDFLPFRSDSRAAIEQSHAGKAMILALWSVDCAYCADDLKLLGDVVRRHPDVALVTVCTDSRETAENAGKVLNGVGLPLHARWLFAEKDTERLRYNIDKKWYGELPRTYFYDAQHQVKAVSGRPDAAWLEQWLKGLPGGGR
ncbi:hypothetical protein MTYP_01349 [Methylophilaceae bacterium]|nr:hypothetical protein MTYP_01349 [Methylophilaceae bacterium]